jgi:hypothetical protein
MGLGGNGRTLVAVQVVLLVLATAGLIGASYAVLAPTAVKKGTEYKFMHCKECGFERPYEPTMADRPCPMCRPPKVGYFVPTMERIGGGTQVSPWWSFRIAAAAEVVAFMAGLWWVLSRKRPAADEGEEMYCRCPHCKWRLRFREKSAGKPGQCPRCKRFFRFPEEIEWFPADEEVGAE